MFKGLFVLFFLMTPSLYSATGDDFPFDAQESSADQIEKGLSQEGGLSESEKTIQENEKTEWGGSLRSDLMFYQFDHTIRDDYIYSPFVTSLFLDHKWSDHLRFFFRGQGTYHLVKDPIENELNSSAEENKDVETQLDELKVQFLAFKNLFVSLGVQKLKWGAGRFWNPSDFLNQEVKNLVEKEDRRAGLRLAKFHLPVNESNFYYITHFSPSHEQDWTGHALRYEVPIPSSITPGEISLTYYGRKNQEGRGAGDISFALGPIDVYFEGAFAQSKEMNSFVAGVNYEWQYSDQDFLVFNLESFSNPGGVSSPDDYLGKIMNEQFIPFHVAQRYLAGSLYFPKPWHLTHTDFSIMLIHNQVDQGHYLRWGAVWYGYKKFTVSFFAGTRFGGSQNSEFRLGGLNHDYLARAEYQF